MIIFNKINKKYIILILIILILTILYMNYHNKINNNKISDMYYNLNISIKNKNHELTTFYSKEIIKNFKNTVQYDLSCIILSKEYIKKNKKKEAKKYLKLIINNNKTNLYDIANIKLIKIIIDEKKYEKALLLIKKHKDITYKDIYKELKGDVLIKLNMKQKAEKAYKNAYKLSKNKDYKNNILKLKILNSREST